MGVALVGRAVGTLTVLSCEGGDVKTGRDGACVGDNDVGSKVG